MNDVMHDLLNKLRVIGKIKEGQKLNTSGNELYIYTDGWVNWVLRKWTRDNKDEGVRALRDLYKVLGQSIETLLNETKSTNEAKKALAIYITINVALELKNSIRGLESLSKTYVGYPTTIAALDGLVRDYCLIIYKSLLEVIPSNKTPKELKESIMYCGSRVFQGSNEILPDTEVTYQDQDQDQGQDQDQDQDSV